MIRIFNQMKPLITILFLLPLSLFAQEEARDVQNRLRQVSRNSVKIPEEYTYSTYHLAGYLASGAQTDLEKVRSFYVWMANNITYDMIGYRKNNLPDYRPKAVLHNRLAVCEGYARLFNELCAESGVRSEIIRGYAKGLDYQDGQRFGMSNHSWNAVFIDGQWHFIDVTWAARRRNDSDILYPLNEDYFLTAPERLIKDHLPEIPAWQLLSNPVSKADFEANRISLAEGNYNYLDSLEVLLGKPENKRTITYQLMARDFDPENDAANYYLGLEYRFNGLDLLEAIYKVNEIDTSEFNRLEKSSFESFDEAALYFVLIKPGNRYYESAQVYLDDTDFERGVFKYEVAHRIMELYNRFDDARKRELRTTVETLILENYSEAAVYFEKIPRHSWYYEKAQEYLNNFLNNPFEPN